MIWRYRYHGLAVHSEISIPEWSIFAVPGGHGVETADSADADSVVVRRESPDTQPEVVEGEYRFFAKQAGWFIVRRGREILLIPLPGACETRLRSFLLGRIWGALMYQRGALLLHASAVLTESGAVAFCARRGAGKSTLAAQLSTLGYPLVSDDLCCIRMSTEGLPGLYPSLPRLRLREDAAVELGWSTAPSQSDQSPPEKFHYYPAHNQLDHDLRLRRIYLLSWGKPEIHRLRGFSALTRLTSAGTWRGNLLIAAGDPASQISRYALLLREVECWEFRRPHDLTSLGESISQLLLHMSK